MNPIDRSDPMAPKPSVSSSWKREDEESTGRPASTRGRAIGRVRSQRTMECKDDEADLTTRFRSGDPDAFSDVYEKYHRNVHSYILSRTRDQNEAEDLTQETFVQALRSIGGFEGRSSILTWLLGIARFLCLRAYRNTTRWMTGTNAVHYDHDPAYEARTEARIGAVRELDRCVEILERRRSLSDRGIFYLRYFEHMAVREIAEEVGKTRDSIKTSLSRSRKALQSEFEMLENAA